MDIEAKKIKEAIEADVAGWSVRLNEFDKGILGLTPDAVKQSLHFRTTKSAFNTAFAKQRAFNTFFLKTFKKEIAADRAARFR